MNLGSAGTYPNGLTFSPNDLRSPAILQRVYARAELDDYGLSYRDFAAAISVTPTSETYEGVIERYRSRLGQTNLTFAERQQIEEEFANSLRASLATGAVVQFNLPARHNIPPAVGRMVVTSIPDVWADIFINQLGVLDLPVPGARTNLISSDLLTELDYPAAFDALKTAFETLYARIDLARSISGSHSLSSPLTDRTLYDIERDLHNLERFSLTHVLEPLTALGINRSPELTQASYQFQLEELGRQIRLANENAAILDRALSTSDTLLVRGADRRLSDVSSGEGMASIPATIVQQFGPELVDRLVSMSVENAGVDFRESLIQAKLEYEQRALVLGVERERIAHRLALISEGRELVNESRLEEIFVTEADRLVEALNSDWDDVQAILAQANLERLAHDKQLFQPLPTPDAVGRTAEFISRTTLLAWIAAGFAGLLLGMFAFMIRALLSNP
ncbi:hypothetical protein [Pelagibacterium limicola]|uniref:hypothetical protein n=1 Tax=Pelagibacterium limicola TaxID=2791022 RepID=UPI0018B00A6D|nr:hypothetical protein [Pelagibacterium limicola]